jgi:hypothetical protein
MSHFEQDPPMVSVNDAIIQAVVLWIAEKTGTSVTDAKSEILTIVNNFHIKRLETSAPAKIDELFEKYVEG